MNELGTRLIFLAAGQGKRMQPLGSTLPKSLLPVKNEPFVARLIRQAVEHGAGDLTVVVGYERDQVRDAIESRLPARVHYVVNERYAEDVNINSLGLALEGNTQPFLVVEADIYLDDCCWPVLLDPRDAELSVWYSRGAFGSHQMGGVLKTDAAGRLTDLGIVPAWSSELAGYKKLMGVTRVGPHELTRYQELLFAYREKSLRHYYLAPWIDHLDELPCVERDLGAAHAISVNTPEEYRQMLEALA
jgi:choline kinase